MHEVVLRRRNDVEGGVRAQKDCAVLGPGGDGRDSEA